MTVSEHLDDLDGSSLRWYLTGEAPTLDFKITYNPPSLRTLGLRKPADTPPPPWYERPSYCFITGSNLVPCECCGVYTAGRVSNLGHLEAGYPIGAPLCVGCDTMRRYAGLSMDRDATGITRNQQWMHEAYDAKPRAVRDYPLEALCLTS